jgi:hypothetical protein
MVFVLALSGLVPMDANSPKKEWVVPLKKSFGNRSRIGAGAILFGALSLGIQALPAQAVVASTTVAIVTPAAGAASGAAFTTQPVIAIQDATNHTLATFSGTVSVALTSGVGGSLIGLTSKASVAGVATFTGLGISGVAGTLYTLTYSSGTSTVATQTISLTPGAPVSLVITRAAGGTITGSDFMSQPKVEIRDAKGNVVTSDTSVVTVAISGAGGALTGSTTATASGGVATYSTLGINGVVGSVYTLTFSDGALKAASQTVIPIAAAVMPAPEPSASTPVVAPASTHAKPRGPKTPNGKKKGNKTK